ncbi:MAG: ACT domain-containing protein [Saprospiraceae bacterium]|nr:ACT domain-containing protein [Saprospiraceae bacterium]
MNGPSNILPSGEKDLKTLISNMEPVLNRGAYVFTSVQDTHHIPEDYIIGKFQEQEGITIIIPKDMADILNLKYDFIAAWITLKVHSSLDAVGLTAAFSTALSDHDISCNVVAGYYHDHIFVNVKDKKKAMDVLHAMSE